MRDVIDPVESFNNLIRSWWKIVAVAILGGLISLAISFIIPPKYQAEATFHASIDFTQINYENMVGEYGDPLVWTQFEEDLALQAVQKVILTGTVNTFQYAQTLDPSIYPEEFRKNHQIQRHLANWYLRYRHEDPMIAQAIVNFWAEQAIEAFRSAQEEGNLESFVIADLTSLAELPETPIYQNRNVLILAGTVAGFFVGILIFDFRYRFVHQDNQEK